MKNLFMSVLIGVFLVGPTYAENFREDFDTLDYNVWNVSDWRSPAFKSGHHYGKFVPDNVWVDDGHLVLKLTQSIDQNGFIYSIGSEISSNQTFSYGTFEFRARFSNDSYSPDELGNPTSGSVGAAFLYLHEPFSEIDIEVENSKPDKMHTVTWSGNKRNKEHFEVDNNNVGFKTYKIVWEPESVSFYVDGNLVSIHMGVVPTEPSKMFFNHWGTDSKWWGGNATIGHDRYMLVDYFSYVPLD